MLKNVAGQIAQSQMVTAADGSAFTGTVTAYVTGDGGTQAIGSVGSGICTHEGNGLHTYTPAQAETNFDNVAFTFIGTGATPATEQYTTGVDVIAISGDTTAADNLELDYDGTGFDKSNSTIGITADAVDDIWDEVLIGATHNVNNSSGRRLRQIQENLGYEGGAVWVDTVNGVAGTEGFENGTVENPVDNIADANTLATNLGLSIFNIIPGSSFTFAASQINQLFTGSGWTVALGGQAIDGTTFLGATVSGIGTSSTTPPRFENCSIGTTTLPPCTQSFCQWTGTITLGSVGDYFFNDCRSGVAGASSPMIDYNSIGSSSTVNLRAFSGGLDGMNIAATTISSWEFTNGGTAQVTGTGGTVFIRGQVSNTLNNSLGSVTMDITGVMNQTTNGVVRTDVARGSGIGNNQIELDTGASSVDGAYDPAQIAIIKGTGAGQSRMGLEYDGSTKMLTVDRNWKVNPDSTSTFLITTNPGREHVNEGLAQSGTISTIMLNVLASSDDDTYNGQTIFIRSGTGEDQARLITDYNGTTKVATINIDWDVTPDSTSGYVMLPTSLAAVELIADAVWTSVTGAIVATEVGDLHDIELGDRIETSVRLIINKVGTSTPVLDKTISGSLLQNNVIITTEDTP